MTMPTVAVNTSNLDAGTDSRAAARVDIFDAVTKLNQIIDHIEPLGADLLDDTTTSQAQTTLDVPSRSGSGATGTWPIGVSGTATTATNLAGGGAGQVPYQSASGTTAMLAAGTAGQVLQSNGTSAPTWVTPSGITINSSVATTSGTAITISTSIPSTAKRVCIHLRGVSTNGTSPAIIQFGNGSFVSSGYLSYCTSTTAGASATNGFIFTQSQNASVTSTGAFIFNNIGNDVWSGIGNFTRGTDFAVQVCAGEIDLSSALDRIRITTSGGTDSFDAGSVVLTWE